MPVSFDNNTIYQVQQANDIVDVIGEHVSLAKKGREMVGLCPFHDDHRPSMYVNSTKQIFKCFACGAGGDVLKFVQMRENLTFPQAIERLAERVGIKLKFTKNVKDKAQKSAEIDPNKLAKVNAWAAEHFHKNLMDEKKGKTTRDYIAKRKIPIESVIKWQIGMAGSQNNLLDAAKTHRIPVKLLAQAGLITGRAPGHSDKFVNRLMFPIADVTGRIIGFGGRTLDEKGPKYINSPTTVLFDKSNSLYGLQQARHRIVSSATAVLVEGYTDCIMAHTKGCKNVVATLGTSFTTGHARILRRYAKKIVLVFDSDTAGIEAANRALDVCLSQHINIKLASVPQHKDPCDFLLEAGKEPFEKLVEEAEDVFRFKWNRLTETFGADETFAGKKAAVEEFLQTVVVSMQSGNMAAIDRGLIVNQLSEIIGLSAKEINAELSKRLSRAQRNASYKSENQKVVKIDLGEGFFAAAQREILEILLNEPELFKLVKQKITAETFDVPILSQTADVLFETLNSRPKASLVEILAKAESVEMGQCITQLARQGEEKANFKSRLNGALSAINRHQLRQRKSEIKTIQDQSRFLRDFSENTEKQNPHNVGMK